jgi:hypothetical protein
MNESYSLEYSKPHRDVQDIIRDSEQHSSPTHISVSTLSVNER